MGQERKRPSLSRQKEEREEKVKRKKMLSLSVLILPSLAAASILPIKFDFGNSAESRPSLRSVQQCEGHENDALVLIEGTTPDEICMPGTTVINMHTLIRKDLPTDLTLNLDLHKITPFPEGQPCGCPLLKGDMHLEGIEMPVQDMGPILGEVMKGSYRATAMLYGASKPDKTLGCIEL